MGVEAPCVGSRPRQWGCPVRRSTASSPGIAPERGLRVRTRHRGSGPAPLQRSSFGARSPPTRPPVLGRAPRLSGGRHRGVELVARLALLTPPDLAHLPPCAEEASHLRHVVFHRPVQLLEVVARHPGIHVMLQMPVHAPVDELREWIEGDRPHALSEVGHVVAQAAMHRRADEIGVPVRDVGSQAEEESGRSRARSQSRPPPPRRG